jgi:hypothetical protein
MWEHLQSIAQFVTAIVLLLNYLQSRKNGKIISDVKLQTDGINAKLVKETGDAKFAEGVKHGEEYVKRSEVLEK